MGRCQHRLTSAKFSTAAQWSRTATQAKSRILKKYFAFPVTNSQEIPLHISAQGNVGGALAVTKYRSDIAVGGLTVSRLIPIR